KCDFGVWSDRHNPTTGKETDMDIAALLEKAPEMLNVRQVIGEPYEKNGTTLLPAVSIRGGGGGGSGDATAGAAGGIGGGMGLTARPVGAYVIRDGEVTWLPAIDVNRIILGGQIVAVAALIIARSIARARTKRALALAQMR
ncbi:MAG: hypothetical protein WB793_06870, partial [Candidatus Dormiibacterota bacterium]